MLEHAITAIDRLSSVLEFVVLQTGAKMYGCHILKDHPTTYIHVPLSEDQPRLKQPYHDMLFYHSQLDWLGEYAKDKSWSWCETRPDIIIGMDTAMTNEGVVRWLIWPMNIGFVPNQNAYSLARSLAVFLSIYAAVHGKGAEVSFPGTMKSWEAKSNDSSADIIARQTIHLSLYMPSSQKGEAFNVADSKPWSTWRQKWPVIASYFGLKGVAPQHDTVDALEVRQYICDKLQIWKELELKHGLKPGMANSDLTFPGFEYFLLYQFDFDRQYDMTKMYSTPPDKPFTEERSTSEAWHGAFDRMREAKLIPRA